MFFFFKFDYMWGEILFQAWNTNLAEPYEWGCPFRNLLPSLSKLRFLVWVKTNNNVLNFNKNTKDCCCWDSSPTRDSEISPLLELLSLIIFPPRPNLLNIPSPTILVLQKFLSICGSTSLGHELSNQNLSYDGYIL